MQGTDVLTLPYVEEEKNTAYFFVFLNVITIALSFISAVQDTRLTQLAFDFRTSEYRLKFLKSQSIVCSTCTGFYRFSLVGWFIITALFGKVKYNRDSTIPFWYTVAGLIGLAVGQAYLSYHYPKAKVNLTDPPPTTNNHENSSVTLNRPNILSNVGFSVIFLGGFAYFAVNFFNFNDRENENLYLHSMCFCFMISMWVMVFANGYVLMISFINDFHLKKRFVKNTFKFYVLILVLAYICVLALLVGFSSMGYIKYAVEELRKEMTKIFSISVCLVILTSVPISIWLYSKFRVVFLSEKKPRETTTDQGFLLLK